MGPFPRSLGTKVTTASKNSIGTTAVQMSTVSLKTNAGVTVKASITNSGRVYIGTKSNITANTAPLTDGFELGAGESVWLPIDNVNAVYVIASTTGQKVFWVSA